MTLSRRQFVIGGCSTAIAAMAGGRIGNLIFEDMDYSGTAHAAGATDQILVTIFLRGGCDGLSLVAPYSDDNYRTRRADLAVPEPPNDNVRLDVNNPSFFNGVTPEGFCFHPNTTGVVNAGGNAYGYSLKELYDSGDLAVVHACGLDNDTRSHFDAMDYIERGTPGNKTTSSGWLARHLQAINATGTLPALSSGASSPIALLDSTEAVAATSANTYRLSGPWRYTQTSQNARPSDALMTTLDQIYAGSGPTIAAGRRTIEAIRALRTVGGYNTSITTYPSNSFGDALRNVAQIIKLDMGLRVATIDLGGWDHHEQQGVNGGQFASLAQTLARGLFSFYKDMAGFEQRLTVIVMSEFGRRLGMNASEGTDHGHGNVMLALGGKVNGGKLYGRWPGLLDLDQDQDLKITTDFRTVLSEAVSRVLQNPKLGAVFPGITPAIYSPATALNLFQGADPQIDYTSGLFEVKLPLVGR